MNHQTICIIGAEGDQASALTRALALQTNHRLLLLSDNNQFLESLMAEIKSAKEEASIEMIHCMVEGCWEADMIVIDLQPEQIEAKKEQLAAVANQKIIIHFSQSDMEMLSNPGFNSRPAYQWKNWFPHSSLVRVFIGSLASWVETDDRDAAATVVQLLADAGLNPFASENQLNHINLAIHTAS